MKSVIAIALVLWAAGASAIQPTPNHNKAHQGQDQGQGQLQGQLQGQGQAQGQVQRAAQDQRTRQTNRQTTRQASTQDANLDAAQDQRQFTDVETGDVQTGVQNSSEDNSMFFALATNVPEVEDCIVSKQAGGFGQNGGGIFTWGNTNVPCLLAKMEKEEQHVEVKARLRCGIRAVRKAIAYYEPWYRRQGECIRFLRTKWEETINYRATIERLEEKNRRIEAAFEEAIGVGRGK